ncbi:MAG: hypothetical protein KDD66_13590 [Bdellovibrionales bacterium]|nr:hypothetical protein [Bdellovibrionales bacterium]
MLIHARIAQGLPQRHQLNFPKTARLRPAVSMTDKSSINYVQAGLGILVVLSCALCGALIETSSPGALNIVFSLDALQSFSHAIAAS